MWGIELQRSGEPGLARQVFLALQERILSGQLAQGEALPSTRALANGLGVSRNTISEAYAMLWAEGFLVNRQGAPSRVAEGLALHDGQQGRMERFMERASDRESKIVDTTGANGGTDGETEQPAPRWDFRTGQPDLVSFPWKRWRALLHLAAGSLPTHLLAYSGPKGYEPLCEEIAQWLLRSRSMRVNPRDVFVTAGATQALHLLVEMLCRQGQTFALENPSHPGIRTVMTDKGLGVCWMPVDEQGADVSVLDDKSLAAVYVTPSHQFPLGGILPATRRAALIRLAREKGCFLIEDDYDSEFRYGGMPVSPLHAMDPSCVLYVGTFSKTLFPALRVGFVVLPACLHEQWRHARTYMDVQNPILDQIVCAEFLKTRRMDRHVQRMRRLYGEKRRVLLAATASTFPSGVRPWGDASGLHVALQFQGAVFDERFVHACRDAGVLISPVSRYAASVSEHQDKLLVGYGHLQPDEIREGLAALRQVMSTHHESSGHACFHKPK